MALYQQEEIGRLLMPLSCIAGIHGLQHTLGGILNGLGKQNRAAIHFLVGGTFQIFCTWILVAQPHLGIYGYIIGFIANTIFVTTLHFRTVIYTIKLPVQWTEWFIKPVFASLVTGSVLRLSYLFLSDRGYGTAFALFFASMIGIAVLLLALYATGSLSQLIEFIYSKNSRANRRYDT